MERQVAPELVACIADGRAPTVEELGRLASRIAHDISIGRSAFTWGDLASDSSVRLISYRIAHAALTGTASDKTSDLQPFPQRAEEEPAAA